MNYETFINFLINKKQKLIKDINDFDTESIKNNFNSLSSINDELCIMIKNSREIATGNYAKIYQYDFDEKNSVILKLQKIDIKGVLVESLDSTLCSKIKEFYNQSRYRLWVKECKNDLACFPDIYTENMNHNEYFISCFTEHIQNALKYYGMEMIIHNTKDYSFPYMKFTAEDIKNIYESLSSFDKKIFSEDNDAYIKFCQLYNENKGSDDIQFNEYIHRLLLNKSFKSLYDRYVKEFKNYGQSTSIIENIIHKSEDPDKQYFDIFGREAPIRKQLYYCLILEKALFPFFTMISNPSDNYSITEGTNMFDEIVLQCLYGLYNFQKLQINHNDTHTLNILIFENNCEETKDIIIATSKVKIILRNQKYIAKFGDFAMSQKYSNIKIINNYIDNDYYGTIMNCFNTSYDIALFIFDIIRCIETPFIKKISSLFNITEIRMTLKEIKNHTHISAEYIIDNIAKDYF